MWWRGGGGGEDLIAYLFWLLAQTVQKRSL